MVQNIIHHVLNIHHTRMFKDGDQNYQHYSRHYDTSSMGDFSQERRRNQNRLVEKSHSERRKYPWNKIAKIFRRVPLMSLGSLANSDTFLAKSLVSIHDAKVDAREYHKLETNVPLTLQFIIEDKEQDITVERIMREDKDGKQKPVSQTTFQRVINLGSEVQEPKPLRTSSVRLLKKLTEQFDQDNFTLEVMKYGENFDTDYRVKVVKQ